MIVIAETKVIPTTSTKTCLEYLKQQLFMRYGHKLDIFEVPAGKTMTDLCGFAIYDYSEKEFIWSGNEFRPDKSGTGGNGCLDAIKAIEASSVDTSFGKVDPAILPADILKNGINDEAKFKVLIEILKERMFFSRRP